MKNIRNAKMLERMIKFRENGNGLSFIKEIIFRKIFYQFSIIKERPRIKYFSEKINNTKQVSDLFIIEAEAAREYWSKYKDLILDKIVWCGRKPHNKDLMNDLLDIGYHYLIIRVTKIFEEIDLPYELGILHKAQSRNSKPLVYDFIEWLRPVTVDLTLLKFLQKKKVKINNVSSLALTSYINLIKKNLSKKYYNPSLDYCISLEYWAKLNLLSLQGCINHNTLQKFTFPSLRHESRCKTKAPSSARSCTIDRVTKEIPKVRILSVSAPLSQCPTTFSKIGYPRFNWIKLV